MRSRVGSGITRSGPARSARRSAVHASLLPESKVTSAKTRRTTTTMERRQRTMLRRMTWVEWTRANTVARTRTRKSKKATRRRQPRPISCDSSRRLLLPAKQTDLPEAVTSPTPRLRRRMSALRRQGSLSIPPLPPSTGLSAAAWGRIATASPLRSMIRPSAVARTTTVKKSASCKLSRRRSVNGSSSGSSSSNNNKSRLHNNNHARLVSLISRRRKRVRTRRLQSSATEATLRLRTLDPSVP